MSQPIRFGATAVVVLLAAIGWRLIESSDAREYPCETKNNPPAAAPLCPWREPQTDLQRFFPDATRYALETRILSGRRVELAKQLGRPPTGDENALHVFRIYRDQQPLGAILTRRVKGAFGAIELVLAVNAGGQTQGLRLQRLREPESVAATLQNPDWLRSLAGKDASSSFKVGRDIPNVPAESRVSAEAIADGARSLLILLAAADQTPAPSPGTAHGH